MTQKTDAFYKSLDACYQAGDLEALEQMLLQHEAEALKETSSVNERIAVYNELGSFYRGISRYGRSLLAFQRAKEEIQQYFGTDCLEYATLLNNMAGTYRLAGQYDKAISLYREAIDLYCFMSDEDSYAYASVHNNISLVYQETGQIDFAIYHLEKALMLIRTMPEHRQELAVTYSNLTALYYKAGRKETAMRCLEQALRIFESCSNEENVHYAAALNSLAAFLYGSKEYERAISTYQKAAEYTKRFFGENVEYAITHQNMSWAYKELREPQLAAQALEVAERVYLRLFGKEHERTAMVQEELLRIRGEIAREGS